MDLHTAAELRPGEEDAINHGVWTAELEPGKRRAPWELESGDSVDQDGRSVTCAETLAAFRARKRPDFAMPHALDWCHSYSRIGPFAVLSFMEYLSRSVRQYYPYTAAFADLFRFQDFFAEFTDDLDLAPLSLIGFTMITDLDPILASGITHALAEILPKRPTMGMTLEALILVSCALIPMRYADDSGASEFPTMQRALVSFVEDTGHLCWEIVVDGSDVIVKARLECDAESNRFQKCEHGCSVARFILEAFGPDAYMYIKEQMGDDSPLEPDSCGGQASRFCADEGA
jgi:hypothetical protein